MCVTHFANGLIYCLQSYAPLGIYMLWGGGGGLDLLASDSFFGIPYNYGNIFECQDHSLSVPDTALVQNSSIIVMSSSIANEHK